MTASPFVSSEGETNTRRPLSEWFDRGSIHETWNKKSEDTRKVVRVKSRNVELLYYEYVETEDQLDGLPDVMKEIAHVKWRFELLDYQDNLL